MLANNKSIAFTSVDYLHNRLSEITGTPLGKVRADHRRFGGACFFVGILVVVFACTAGLFGALTKENNLLVVEKFSYLKRTLYSWRNSFLKTVSHFFTLTGLLDYFLIFCTQLVDADCKRIVSWDKTNITNITNQSDCGGMDTRQRQLREWQ